MQCPICLESVDTRSDDTWFLPCGDAFCLACIEQYVRIEVGQGRLIVSCPFPKCRRQLEPTELCNLSSDVHTLRRIELIANPELRQCEECGALAAGGSAEAPDMRCPQCSATFCFVHGRMHVGQPCDKYMRTDKAGRRYEQFARKHHLKRCPACKRTIDKYTGCDSMRCTCGHRFNWRQAHTEFPCSCVHVSRKDGLPMWGHLCPSHDASAVVKLAAWRALYVVVGTGVILPVGVAGALGVGCGVAMYKLGRAGIRGAKHAASKQRAKSAIVRMMT